MSDGSSIEWTDATWQVSYGCSRKSSGCENCYAERFVHRGLAPAHRGLTVIRGGRPGWTGEVRLAPENLGIPLRWRKPRRVFVNSMSDLFHERVPFEFIAAVFGVMAACRQHTFLVLTKRPARALEFFAWAEAQGAKHDLLRDGMPDALLPCAWAACCPNEDADPNELHHVPERREDDFVMPTTEVFGTAWPLPNVHLGVSAEDQATWDERVPLLLQCPAAVRWVSAEPLLGPINVSRHLWPTCWHWAAGYGTPEQALAAGAYAERKRQRLVGAGSRFVDWIVVGGESGPGARPFDVAWARAVVGQCRDAGVPVFVKQLGARPVGSLIAGCEGPIRFDDRKGGDPDEWPADLRVREFPEVR